MHKKDFWWTIKNRFVMWWPILCGCMVVRRYAVHLLAVKCWGPTDWHRVHSRDILYTYTRIKNVEFVVALKPQHTIQRCHTLIRLEHCPVLIYILLKSCQIKYSINIHGYFVPDTSPHLNCIFLKRYIDDIGIFTSNFTPIHKKTLQIVLIKFDKI